MAKERRVHPDCRNASNPYHECVEYCFRRIAEVMARKEREEIEVVQVKDGNSRSTTVVPDEGEEKNYRKPDLDHQSDDVDDDQTVQDSVDVTKLTGRQKKLFELRLKMIVVDSIHDPKVGVIFDPKSLIDALANLIGRYTSTNVNAYR